MKLNESIMKNLKEELKENEEVKANFNFTEHYYVINEDDFNALVEANKGVFDRGYLEISKEEFIELADKYYFFSE